MSIPIYVQVATDDASAPIESTYLIPLEFAPLGKSNLTNQVCVGCDHSFRRKNKDGKFDQRWDDIFRAFMVWTEEID